MGVLRDGFEDILGFIVEQQDIALLIGIPRALLAEHLDEHIVRGLINEGNHHLLPVDGEGTVRVLRHRRLGDLPDKVPGQCIRQLVTQLFDIGLVDIAGLGRAHIGYRIAMLADVPFGKIFRHDLVIRNRIKFHCRPAQTVFLTRQQLVQRRNHVAARQIRRHMVGIGDADVGRGARSDIGDDVVVDIAVIGVKAEIDANVGIIGFKFVDGLLVEQALRFIGVVFRPEGDFIFLGFVKLLRQHEFRRAPRAVAGSKAQRRQHQQQRKA